jgi:hypothetical protein
MAKVLDNLGRKLFEGPMDAAKAWVDAHFPSVHVDPHANIENPQPDVHIVDDPSESSESEETDA